MPNIHLNNGPMILQSNFELTLNFLKALFTKMTAEI